VAETLRAAVRQVALPDSCPLRELTASIGIAVYPEDGTDLDLLLAAADRAMYAAKHGGRDMVARASDSPVAGVTITLPLRRVMRRR